MPEGKHWRIVHHAGRFFFGAFVKLLALYVCLPVRPSVGMEQFGSKWTDFHED
jgi:hypothetical protein